MSQLIQSNAKAQNNTSTTFELNSCQYWQNENKNIGISTDYAFIIPKSFIVLGPDVIVLNVLFLFNCACGKVP
jgi:hypothetical protein